MKHTRIFLALLLVLVMGTASFAASAASRSARFTFPITDGNLTGGIAAQGNALLFGTETGAFYAVNKNTGNLLWSYEGTNTIIGTPLVIGSNVFFAQGDGTITCLNAVDGSRVWSYVPPDGANEMVTSGLAAGDGKLFATKSDNKLYAIDQKNGRTLWTYTASSQGLRTSPAYSNGLVFLGEYDGIFSVIDAKSGKRLNGGGAGGALNTPVVASGNVYVSSWDGSVQAIKINGIEPLWNIKVGDTVTTAPVVGSGVIVVGTGRGRVAGIDARNGSIIWNFDTEGGEISVDPLIAGEVVYVAVGTGQILVLDLKTGRTRYVYGSEFGGTLANMLVSDGVFYFGNRVVYAF